MEKMRAHLPLVARLVRVLGDETLLNISHLTAMRYAVKNVAQVGPLNFLDPKESPSADYVILVLIV